MNTSLRWIKPVWCLMVLGVTLWVGWMMFEGTLLCGGADCHCEDVEWQSLCPLWCLLPMLLVRCFSWRRTLGVVCAITAIASFIVQHEHLCDCILLLTGDKQGYLHSHDVVCYGLLKWNLMWLFGMIVSGVLFLKARRIGRSLKAPWRWMCMKIVKRRKGT